MQILIVDDDLEMARHIGAHLDARGIAFDIASSAEQAHRLFLLHDYDGLIVDVVLPEAGGLSLVRECHSLRPGLPVLFCTGATDEFNRKLLAGQGAVCHKPLDKTFPDQLQRFIQDVVDKPRA